VGPVLPRHEKSNIDGGASMNTFASAGESGGASAAASGVLLLLLPSQAATSAMKMQVRTFPMAGVVHRNAAEFHDELRAPQHDRVLGLGPGAEGAALGGAEHRAFLRGPGLDGEIGGQGIS